MRVASAYLEEALIDDGALACALFQLLARVTQYNMNNARGQ